jgi:ketosteroid isomerase-like protein
MALDKAAAVRALFQAFLSGNRDRAETLLSDDFTFTSQYDDAIDKATYFERCWPNRSHLTEHHIERIIADADAAFVLYYAATDNGKRFRNAECFTFDGDRIKSVEVFFGRETAA